MGEVGEVAVVGVGVGVGGVQVPLGQRAGPVAVEGQDESWLLRAVAPVAQDGEREDGADAVGAGPRGVYGPVGGGITLAAAARARTADMDADGLGVTLFVAGELRLMGYATDERTRRMEDAQLTTGKGPCTDAFVRRTLVEEADLHQARTTGGLPSRRSPPGSTCVP
ncbi:hypothetical protein [Streptomyces kanamyceticus]|uniref:hypothetical protein n=1 Tax=Streptomyces kanamyceticus TaxID=1967 RepID=UPI0037DD716A